MAKAPAPFRRESPARTRVGARLGTAWPGPGCVSRRARACGSASWLRRTKRAAAAQATAGRPAGFAGRQCRSVGPRMPGLPGRGGHTPPHPGRGGSAGYRGVHRAGPGPGWCPPWPCAPTVKGGGVRGRGHARPCQVCHELVVVGQQGPIALEALWARGSGQAVGHAGAVRWVRELLADRREVVGAMGRGDRRQERRAVPPPESTGGTPGSGRDHGLRPQGAPEQARHRWRIELGVGGRPAMARAWRGHGRAPMASLREHSAPPAKTKGRDTRRRLLEGRDRAQALAGPALERPAGGGARGLRRQGSGGSRTCCGQARRYPKKMAAVGCRSAWGLLRSAPALPRGSIPPWSAEEEASISINRLQVTADSVRCAPASGRG
jgi:hypothetical protein